MPELVLSERQQHALRVLLEATAAPEALRTLEDVLLTVGELIPCDAIGASAADDRGRSAGHRLGHGEELSLVVRSAAHRVVRLRLDRTSAAFTDRDAAMLVMIAPALQRLIVERTTAGLSASLTVAERRVLAEVAAGRSNAEIAADLFVAASTVRKHLEHAFRKLGVTNRFAAVAALQGRDVPQPDHRPGAHGVDERTFA